MRIVSDVLISKVIGKPVVMFAVTAEKKEFLSSTRAFIFYRY